MLNAGQPGFTNAPVTKVVIVLVVVTTLFGSILGSQKRLVLSLPDISSDWQIWRLFTHNFVFSTPGELLFGVVLLYYFRQFERHLGSSRYAAIAFATATIHTVVLCIFQFLLPDAHLASGPYALIFAALVHFFFETPPIYTFQLFGSLALTDKFFPYLLASQLALSAPARSAIPVASALVAGLAVRAPAVADKVAFPKPVVEFASATILPFLNTAPAPRSQGRRRSRTASAAATAHVGVEANGDGVSARHVDTLQAMGFTREQVVTALQRSGDDVQLATERLLSESS